MIPDFLSHLGAQNGYPIPYTTYVNEGVADFAVNDDYKVNACVLGGLCAICGKVLSFDNVWFVGGVRSALDPRGMYNDPPVHRDCGAYALATCPYLATPSYIGVKQREKRIQALSDNNPDMLGTIDYTMDPNKPPTFFMIQVNGFQVIQRPGHLAVRMLPSKKFINAIEFKDGNIVSHKQLGEYRKRGLDMLRKDGLTVSKLPKMLKDAWYGGLTNRWPFFINKH
jgi:hypothetical protein